MWGKVTHILGRKYFYWLPLFLALWSCGSLPQPQSQLYIPVGSKKVGDSIHVTINNISHSPIRFFITEKGKVYKKTHSYILNAKTEYSYQFFYADSIDLGTSWALGNPKIETDIPKLNLPFAKEKNYRVLQGYKGEFSHNNSPSSYYAIDFAMPQGDTICAAHAGYVVGLIQGYEKGGRSKRWLPFANLITLYHPVGNYYTQYVHLDKNGALVSLGDEVLKGQAIGIVGKTGYTTVPHLHFNVMKPADSEDGFVSVPYDFEDYKGQGLEIDAVVSH